MLLPIWKSYILHDSKYVTFQKMQNYGDKKKISGGQSEMSGYIEINW